jgi:membrane-bound lytic murein transglycosylase D
MKGLSSGHLVLLGAIPGAMAAGFGIANRLSIDAILAPRLAANQGVEAQMAAAPPTPRWENKGNRAGESDELRALRLDEVEMFPELSGLAPNAPGTGPDACQSPDHSHSASFGQFDTKVDFLKGLRMPDLAVQRHERVAKYLRYFTSTVKGRSLFVQWLKRSGRYRNIIAEHLSRYDLPQDLAAVVFIESGFWPNARSSAGAVGMWQFMEKTGSAYGLVVRPDYDERRSIWASTDAAARHLDDLHTRFGNWDMALAAYNAGYGRIEALAQEMGTSDYWQLSAISGGMPTETQLYVPKILAISVIENNLEVFGFEDVELEEPISAEPLDVPPGTRLSLVARAAGTSVRQIRDLNPQILSSTTVPDIGGPVSLHIPASGVSRARALLPRLLGGSAEPLDAVVSDEFDWGRDKLNPEGLSALELTGTPKPQARAVLPPSALGLQEEVDLVGSEVVYEVMAGDTLNEIASSFSVPMPTLVRLNRLRNPSQIMIGQRLRLPVRPDAQGVPVVQELAYRVSRGETLSELAKYFGANVTQLAVDNQIKDPTSLQEGQMLRVRVAAAETLRPPEEEGEIVIDLDAPALEEETKPKLPPKRKAPAPVRELPPDEPRHEDWQD